MRRPEEILKETLKEDNLYPAFLNLHPEWLLKNTLKAIQQAQKEAIEETVRRCADGARLEVVEIVSPYNPRPITKNIVCKDSILQVETELKKEL